MLPKRASTRELGRIVRRLEAVASKVEDWYAGAGTGRSRDELDGQNIANVIMGLGVGRKTNG